VRCFLLVISAAVKPDAALQIDIRRRDAEALNAEFERMKDKNTRLEFTCKEYQEKILANDALLNNYQAMQDENRKLYNQIQDLRGNIRVFLRCALPGCLSLFLHYSTQNHAVHLVARGMPHDHQARHHALL
jgi:Microtubule binding